MLLPDERCRPRHQHRVLEHEPLRIEQRAKLPPGQASLNAIELFRRSAACILEPRDLGAKPGRRDGEAKQPGALDHENRTARGDARGHSDAAQTLHESSPKPDSMRPQSASIAVSSSSPSAEIVNTLPLAAARRSMPMMLLPSIVCEPRVTRTAD